MRYKIGVDLGGTTVKMGLFTSECELMEDWEIVTDKSDNGANILDDIVASIDDKLETYNITKNLVDGLGIGVPGPVVKGVVYGCTNIGWGDVNLVDELNELIGLQVYADNDANVAALGEYYAGSGKDYSSILMVTLGTGVGGGIIIDGNIIQGVNGYAGELGHMLVNYNETDMCTCGKCGCLEQYSSATGVKRLALKHLSESNNESSLKEFGETINAKIVFEEAKKGDNVALKTVDECLTMLGRGIANVCHVINPEAVILGGGMSNAGDYMMHKLRSEFDAGMIFIKKDTKLVLASLGSRAGIYGACHLVG